MTTRKSSNSSSTTTTTMATGTVTPCCSKVGIKRGPWTAEEDEVLAAFVRKEGEGRWRTLPKRAGLARCGKSCRLRWMNYLRPSVKRGHIAADEEDLILRLHRLLGNRWSLIAGRIPGRTDNEIKNYWNTHLSKKLISQGIDPRTHKPFKPDPDDKTINSNSPSSCKTDDDEDHRPCSPNNTNKKMKIKHTHDDHDKTIIVQENIPSTMSSENNNNNNDDIDHRTNRFENDVSNNISTTDQLLSDDQVADDLNYCTDDVFSFLNSLINEDAFPPMADPFLPIDSGCTGWESTIGSSSSSSAAAPLNQIKNNQG